MRSLSLVSSFRSPRSLLLGLALALPIAVSCGGDVPPPATPAATPPGSPDAPPTPPPATTGPAAGTTTTWKEMNHDQRLEFMKSTVLPKMKAEFAEYDAKRFGNINCGTCHGEGMKDGSFKMPNAKLPKVPNDMPGFQALAKAQPDAMKFMSTKVVQDMAKMLGKDPFDPKTGKGFGCHECHTSDK